MPGRATDEFAPAAVWPPPTLDVSPTPEGPGRSLTTQASIGHLLMVMGFAWFVSGLLAMHVFGVMDAISSAPIDLAFHASGLWVATLGVALRFQPPHVQRRAA
jgi:hypothetical protein